MRFGRQVLEPYIFWYSFLNLWFLLRWKNLSYYFLARLKDVFNWQPVVGFKIRLVAGLAVQELHVFRLASSNDNIQSRGAHLLSSLFLCPCSACKPEPSWAFCSWEFGLGRTEGQPTHSFFLHNPPAGTDIVNGRTTPLPFPNSSLNLLCHPLRP